MEAFLFLKAVLRECPSDPVVMVDRGVWYPWALDTLGVKWWVQRGGPRSLVESYFGSLKWRLGKMKRRRGTWHTLETLPGLVRMHAWRWNLVR